MTGDISKNREAGMTLIEVLVATAIIGITMSIAVTIFVLFYRSSQESSNELQLQATARQALTLITERTRDGYVDYDFYTGAPSAESDFFAIRDLDGVQTAFQFYYDGTQTNVYICDDKPVDQSCDKVSDPETSVDWSQINPEGHGFIVGQFTISPDDPPYIDKSTIKPLSDQAPFVTITMQLESDTAETNLIQTAITPRIYVR